MKTSFKILVALSIISTIFLLVFVFKPILPFSTLKNSVKIIGEVSGIYESVSDDINFRIKDDSSYYYIEKGIKHGLNPVSLNDSLQNKEIILYYADINSWLDPENRVRHITRVEYNGRILYNEIVNFE